MGRQRRDQGKLFYEFRLDDRIPQNHLLRRIDVFVTSALADLHKELEPYYSEIGRPSVDVNRRWIGTPYRHPKGTPLSGEFGR